MEKKKLLFVVNVDWFFFSHRLPISIEAIKQGYEVHIATTITDKLDILKGNGLIVHPLNLSRSNKGVISIFSEFREIYSVIRDVNPNLVHLISIKPVLLGGIAARLNRIPAVVSAVSGLGFIFIRKGLISKFFRYLVSIMYRLCFGHKNQCIIFQNLDDQLKLTKLTKISENKTALIHGSGVDLSIFNYSTASVTDKPVVMLASRLLEDKGVREFIQAAKLVKKSFKSVRFVLVGEPDYKYPLSIQHEELEQWKKDGIVEIWGYRSDMNIVLSMANIFVLPSYREGFSKVLSEASAIGRVIITTNVPGCRDVVEDGVTGILIPERNTEILASKISYLIDNPFLCEEMGRAGRKKAEKMFDVKQVISQHMAIYKKLLDN
jgi:glycosyltransferase involved in cell wall biosynthesis